MLQLSHANDARTQVSRTKQHRAGIPWDAWGDKLKSPFMRLLTSVLHTAPNPPRFLVVVLGFF